MILCRTMANDDQFNDTLLGKGGPLEQEEYMEDAGGDDATNGAAMGPRAAAVAMEQEAIPVGNKLHQEIGLDAAVRQRRKGAAKLKAAADLAAAEERGYQNGLAAVKTAASQRPAFQRPGNDSKPLRTADGGINKPDRRWACNRCNFLNFPFRTSCFNNHCKAPRNAISSRRNTSNAGCYDGSGNINDNDRNDGNNHKKNESKIDKMTNLILVLSKLD